MLLHVKRRLRGLSVPRVLSMLTGAVMSVAFARDIPPGISVGVLRDSETPYAEFRYSYKNRPKCTV